MSEIVVYYSDVAGSVKIKKDTTRMLDLLDIHKIPYRKVDVSVDEEAKTHLKEHSKAKAGVLPQVFIGGAYCGTIVEVEEANEDGRLKEFLAVSN